MCCKEKNQASSSQIYSTDCGKVPKSSTPWHSDADVDGFWMRCRICRMAEFCVTFWPLSEVSNFFFFSSFLGWPSSLGEFHVPAQQPPRNPLTLAVRCAVTVFLFLLVPLLPSLPLLLLDQTNSCWFCHVLLNECKIDTKVYFQQCVQGLPKHFILLVSLSLSLSLSLGPSEFDLFCFKKKWLSQTLEPPPPSPPPQTPLTL